MIKQLDQIIQRFLLKQSILILSILGFHKQARFFLEKHSNLCKRLESEIDQEIQKILSDFLNMLAVAEHREHFSDQMKNNGYPNPETALQRFESLMDLGRYIAAKELFIAISKSLRPDSRSWSLPD